MNLKHKAETPSILRQILHEIWTYRRFAWLFLSGLLCVGASGLGGVYYGIQMHKTRAAESFDDFLEQAIASKLSIIPHTFRGMLYARPERITIDIKHEDFQRLAYKREMALEQGILITGEDDFVPAKIRYKDKIYKARIRLKGDWVDHLLGEKWSFRLVLKGDHTLFGMKQFSLHHPRARNFIYEWLYQKALSREGMIALRYDFIEVTLNGKDLGVYALEEHFEKRLVEHNAYREGPILKFDESVMWADRAITATKGEHSPAGIQVELAAALDVFKANSTLHNPTLRDAFLSAHTMLEAFRNGKVPAHQVFDMAKLAKLFALSDLFGADHSVVWHNLRFYYNPVTALLEPIGFDANAGGRINQLVGANRSLAHPGFRFKERVFSDLAFYEAYIHELERMSQPAYVEALLDTVAGEMQEKLDILYSEFPYFSFSKRFLEHNQKIIAHALRPVKAVHAYFKQNDRDAIILDLGNMCLLPVEVLGLTIGDSVHWPVTEQLVLPPREAEAPVRYRPAAFRIPETFVWQDTLLPGLQVAYRILGTSARRKTGIYAWPREQVSYLESAFVRREANVHTFDCFQVDLTNRRIAVKPGTWIIDRDVKIPAGYEVAAQGGTVLDLREQAVIYSASPLLFRGEAEKPIRIVSGDSSGQGIAVISAAGQSVLEYVVVDNLAAPAQPGWQLTGAVTFYESPVIISHCRFLNNRSEDALNTIRTSYEITNSLFSGTRSDAFDGDFSHGRISRTSFIDCGNDAIDISGSTVQVQDVTIVNAGDKGLSAGENSRLLASKITIRDTEIAVAGKDLSVIEIDGMEVANCKVGFALFQKKPEFDAAEIRVRGFSARQLSIPYLVETRSRLVIDGREIAPTHEKVEPLLYGAEFGKSSK